MVMATRVFGAHGEFCATHPWEVIVAALTLTACAASVERGARAASASAGAACAGWARACPGLEAEYQAADAAIMTAVRCAALLYAYYQFCNLNKIGSKYILALTGVFTVFASFVFTSALVNLFWTDIGDLKDSPFLFLLVVDVARGVRLARVAASAGRAGLARGLALLGPPATLDAVLEALLVGVGSLSGVPRLESMCTFACLAVLVNYLVFITFYPACLSLTMELSGGSGGSSERGGGERGGAALSVALSAAEREHKPNPVVQRVKLIMAGGLLMVHLGSRWTLRAEEEAMQDGIIGGSNVAMNNTNDALLHPYVKWFSVSADHIVILILLSALTVKFIFFEEQEREDLTEVADMSTDIPTASMDGISSRLVSRMSALNLHGQDDVRRRPIFEITDASSDNKETQTYPEDLIPNGSDHEVKSTDSYAQKKRSIPECLEIYRSETGASALSDEEVVMLVEQSHIPLYRLESVLDNALRGVRLRRRIVGSQFACTKALEGLPYLNYDYSKVMNACCENVLGYVGVPVGYAGPLVVDGVSYAVPMATTEGALVASTNRGAKAIGSRGVTTVVTDVGMTRAPVVRLPNVVRAHEVQKWIEDKDNFELIKEAFDGTSRFARLRDIHIGVDGPQLYIRFSATTGDAMGMNMVSKGAEMALMLIKKYYPDMEVVSLSGNYCSDKKAAAINWIKGRGKRVVCETIISAETLKKIFKTDAKTISRCNKMKNFAGSALAGSIGGNNAHAANMVTAIFIATGQDPAQNVTSSNCSTNMETCGDNGDDLYITCTMPSLEVGTVGGGTVLDGQGANLSILNLRGSAAIPAQNSSRLASVICATVLAGEISLMAALVNSELVRSHMRHNRSTANIQLGEKTEVESPPQRNNSLAPPPHQAS